MTQIAVIADQATVTGFLLSGAGCKQQDGKTNFHIVTYETQRAEILYAFSIFTENQNCSILFITKFAADKIRDVVAEYKGVTPVLMEIPSREDE